MFLSLIMFLKQKRFGFWVIVVLRGKRCNWIGGSLM